MLPSTALGHRVFVSILASTPLGWRGRSPSGVEVLFLVECRCPSEVEGRLIAKVIYVKNRPCHNASTECFALTGLVKR